MKRKCQDAGGKKVPPENSVILLQMEIGGKSLILKEILEWLLIGRGSAGPLQALVPDPGGRGIEWRCVFTSISFFVLSVGAIYRGDITLDDLAKNILSISFLILSSIATIFLAYLHMAGNKDKELAEQAEDAISTPRLCRGVHD